MAGDWVKVYFLWRPNLPDEADNHLIELALAGSADTIVTNNLKDFKAGELRFPDLTIQSPRQFLTTLP
jgi:predicted nucleic acid-binding protein